MGQMFHVLEEMLSFHHNGMHNVRDAHAQNHQELVKSTATCHPVLAFCLGNKGSSALLSNSNTLLYQ